MTYEPDLANVNQQIKYLGHRPFCTSYCPDTQTQPMALSGPPKRPVNSKHYVIYYFMIIVIFSPNLTTFKFTT